MRKRTDNPSSINVNVNVNITVGDGKKTAKPKFKWLVPVLGVVVSVAVPIVVLLTVPDVDPVQCAKLVRTFISTLVVG